ncbi:hypothetical protein LSAT2_024435 [Lamellibrachia satsuma]|nr:hypothetical protein LSAT2_024435 [Lamellibrachia satsuma]
MFQDNRRNPVKVIDKKKTTEENLVNPSTRSKTTRKQGKQNLEVITVQFHVVVSHDFKIDKSDMVIVRFDSKWAEGGGWECKRNKLTQERKVNDGHLLFGISMEIPKIHLTGSPGLQYKYAILKSGRKGVEMWEYLDKRNHFLRANEKNRILHVPVQRINALNALFTSIPVREAVSVVKDRLNQDTTLKGVCELSVNQIITLLENCLNTTYLIYDGVLYKQKKGATLGSLVSPIVANLYMEHFEEKVMREAPHPPDIWLRYVDDTFTVLQESKVEHFTHHLNSVDENIKFTIEPEQDNNQG